MGNNESPPTRIASISIPSMAIHVASSPDGRLVAVACADGSLQCYNNASTSQQQLTHRWTIANAHSHTSGQDSASGAGVSSLAFSCSSSGDSSYYPLVLVDYAQGLSIYHAAAKSPQCKTRLDNVTSAAWSTTFDALAVGDNTGCISIYQYSFENGSLSQITCSQIPFAGESNDAEGWSCSHLDWSGTTLVAGMLRVIPSDEEEDEDDEDDDDAAEHQANLFVGTIDMATFTLDEWFPQGDVVPFFSLPKHGRHVFFTSILTETNPPLIVVAANVASDIGIIALDGNGTTWNVAELQEGNAAMTPTDDEDEFTYPVGIAVLGTNSGSPYQLVLGATDGSLSIFNFMHEMQPDLFVSQRPAPAALPNSPVPEIVEEQEESSFPPELAQEPSSSAPATPSSGFNFGLDAKPSFQMTPSPAAWAAAPSPSPFGAPTASTGGFGFGQPSVLGATASPNLEYSFGMSSALGSPAAPSSSGGVFGSGSAGGLSFGGGGGASTFGSAAAPAFGSSSNASVFGSQSSKPGGTNGGFAALSATIPETGGFGSLASSSSKSSPFGAFDKTAASTPASMIKPLFGTGTPTPAKETTPAPKKEGTTPTKTPTVAATATPESKPKPKTTTPASSSADHTFGSGNKTPTFGTMSLGGFGAAASPSAASPFSFETSAPTSGIPSSMVKPLFGSKPTISPEKEATKAEIPKPVTESTLTNLTGAAKTAARIFDQFDEYKTGSLSVDIFEDMTDELGEGLHGDEYEKQISRIDPSGSGTMKRAAFIDWYSDLVDGVEGDDDDSLDSTERAERAEEETKARSKFSELATDGAIDVLDFPKLMESFGTVYCEEEHRRTVKNLKKADDKIHQADFVAWYLGWLFGGDESDEDYDDEDGDGTGGPSSSALKGEGWGNVFEVDQDSWKCEICSCRNPGSSNICPACETPKPGCEDAAKEEKAGSAAASGSIGSTGFSFGGGGSGATGSSGFSFGAPAPVPAASLEADKPTTGGGFSFGSGTGSGFSFGAPAASAAAPSPFSFGPAATGSSIPSSMMKPLFGAKPVGPAPKKEENEAAKALTGPEKTAARVFDQFDEYKTGSLSVDIFEDMTDELGEGLHGDEYEKQISRIDPSGSGTMKRAAFIDWYSEIGRASCRERV